MRQKRTLWGVPLLVAALVAANACSDQGEGERCSKDNDDADCAAGLVCTLQANLSNHAQLGSALCCPPLGVPPTVDACQPRVGVVLDAGGNPPVPDGGSGPHVDASKPKSDASLGGDARPDAP